MSDYFTKPFFKQGKDCQLLNAFLHKSDRTLLFEASHLEGQWTRNHEFLAVKISIGLMSGLFFFSMILKDLFWWVLRIFDITELNLYFAIGQLGGCAASCRINICKYSVNSYETGILGNTANS